MAIELWVLMLGERCGSLTEGVLLIMRCGCGWMLYGAQIIITLRSIGLGRRAHSIAGCALLHDLLMKELQVLPHGALVATCAGCAEDCGCGLLATLL